MLQHFFVSDFLSRAGGRGPDVWLEAGRNIEAGHRAPAPIRWPLRLLIALALMLLLQLADVVIPTSGHPWSTPWVN